MSGQSEKAAGCRYCGILPEQALPRPSYHDLRGENERLRAALARIEVESSREVTGNTVRRKVNHIAHAALAVVADSGRTAR